MKTARWMSLISGVLLIILGGIVINTPLESILFLSVFISVALLVTGIFEIIGYFSLRDIYRSYWLLINGIFSILIGGWLLIDNNVLSLTAVLPYIFAFWLIFSSISMIVGSLELKEYENSNWIMNMVLGIIGVIGGFFLIFSPTSALLAITLSIAIIFIYRGILNISFFFFTRSV